MFSNLDNYCVEFNIDRQAVAVKGELGLQKNYNHAKKQRTSCPLLFPDMYVRITALYYISPVRSIAIGNQSPEITSPLRIGSLPGINGSSLFERVWGIM